MKRKPGLLSAQTAAHRRSLLLLALCSLLLGAAIISQAALVATVVSRIFVDEAAFATIAALLGGLGAVIALRALLGYINGRVGLSIARRAKAAIRQTVIQRLARASIPAALSGQTGGKVSLVMDAVDEADSYFSQYLPRMVETALIPLMLIIVVMTQHWPSGVIMLATAPFIPIFMILVGLRTKTQSEEKFAQLSQFSGAFLDALQGLVSLKLYGRVKAQEEAIERSSLGFREATMSILRIAFTNTFMMELVVMLSIGVVALELAFRMLIAQTLPFGTAFFILMLVPEFYSAIKNLGTAFHSGRTSMGAVKKVDALLEETTERSAAATSERLTLAPAVPPRIELRNVGFSYGADGFELRRASFVIEPGEQVAIVGASGAGKTTLLHLIAGLLPASSGEVLVDSAPLERYAGEDWYAGMSYITQHPYLFAGTIADNIAIGAGRETSRADIERAAEAAGLAPLLAELERGLDTVVGEGGRGLSGGEKQRLALARAFLNAPTLLLFDEPTVGLDLQTERVLQRSIGELSRRATMITVAHRLHTIRQADRILYLEDGVLLGSGRHEELLERLPQYARMVRMQRGGEVV